MSLDDLGPATLVLLVLAALLGGGYLLLRRATDARSDRDTAMEELQSAYAPGDLSDDEFERRRERLERTE